MKNKFNHARIPKIILDGSGANDTVILINGIVHLKFLKKEFIAFQSWYITENDCKIELYLKNKTIILEYNSVEKWKAVIEIISKTN